MKAPQLPGLLLTRIQTLSSGVMPLAHEHRMCTLCMRESKHEQLPDALLQKFLMQPGIPQETAVRVYTGDTLRLGAHARRGVHCLPQVEGMWLCCQQCQRALYLCQEDCIAVHVYQGCLGFSTATLRCFSHLMVYLCPSTIRAHTEVHCFPTGAVG